MVQPCTLTLALFAALCGMWHRWHPALEDCLQLAGDLQAKLVLVLGSHNLNADGHASLVQSHWNMGGGQSEDVEEQHLVDTRHVYQRGVEAEGAGMEGGQDEYSAGAQQLLEKGLQGKHSAHLHFHLLTFKWVFNFLTSSRYRSILPLAIRPLNRFITSRNMASFVKIECPMALLKSSTIRSRIEGSRSCRWVTMLGKPFRSTRDTKAISKLFPKNLRSSYKGKLSFK